MPRSLPVVPCVALVLALASGCGGGGSSEPAVVAHVGGRAVTSAQLDRTVAHFAREARLEGKDFPAEDTPAFRRTRDRLLALLISRAELEAAAARLGVHVTGAQVTARLGAAPADPDAVGDTGFLRDTARAQLILEAVFPRVTAGVAVGDAEVRAYYRSHRALYGASPFASVRAAIRSQLLGQRRNAALQRWEAETRRQLAPTVTYAKGYGPPKDEPAMSGVRPRTWPAKYDQQLLTNRSLPST